MGTHTEPFASLAPAAAALAAAFAAAGARAGAAVPADGPSAARLLADLRAPLLAFGDVAGASGAIGLQTSAGWLQANLDLLSRHGRDLTHFEFRRLVRWPQWVVDYVGGAARASAIAGLLEVLEAPCWPLRPARSEVEQIEGHLFCDVTGAATAAADEAPPAGEPTDAEQPDASAAGLLAALERLCDEMPAVAAASDAGALAGLRDALARAIAACGPQAHPALLEALVRVGENVESIASTERPFDPAAQLSLLDFPALALEFARRPDDADLANALAENLCAADWPLGIPDSEAADLRALFSLPSATAEPGRDNKDASAAPDTPAEPIEPQRVDPQYLALFAEELAGFEQQLAAALESATAAADPATRRDEVGMVAELVQRIGAAAQSIGLLALNDAMARAAGRIRSRAEHGLTVRDTVALAGLAKRLRAHLLAPTDAAAAIALAAALPDGQDEAAAAEIAARLVAIEFAAPTAAPARPTEATPQDVSLDVPADIDAELLDGLLGELPVQTAEFAAAVQRVAAGGASQHELEVAKRAAHTLKGAANTVGVRGIANLTHHLEDVLIALTRAGVMPTGALAAMLSDAADCLEAMSEAVLGASAPPADALHVLQRVLDCANRIDRDGVTDGAAPPPAEAPRKVACAVPGDPAPVAAPGGPALRVPAALVDELLRLVGETMIANAQIREQLRQSSAHARAVTQQNAALLALAGELEHLIDVRGLAGLFQKEQARPDFDALEFEHFNELHTVTRRLIEAATDSRELSAAGEDRLRELGELIEAQGRLHAEHQEVVMKTRMVPASTVVSRLQRGVRQTCRLLDKQVELVVKGADTPLDSNVLNALVEPLMHLLRNAVDHGIEAPAERTRAGKAPVGRVDLSFERDGASIVVRVRDDGAGLDLAAMRAKAAAQGLIADAETPADEDIARLILLPGFSTRDEATHVSGRGIGLDAVNAAVTGLNGSLRLLLAPGQGLGVELRLPASLMTAHALLVRHGSGVVAVSSNGVQDIRYVVADRLERRGAALVYRDHERAYPVDALERLIGSADSGFEERGWFPALMVRTETGAVRAVRVQEVLDSQDLVIKELGHYVARPAGIVGVTILGDGRIAPVLDLPQLLSAPLGVAAALARSRRAHERVEARRVALVVDDSLTARRAAAQLMREAGFDVHTASDGMDAATLLEKQVPDIVLVDMEMPRMNGLELTAHLRSRVATRDVPVIMITSRSTEKHRRQAQAAGVNVYVTKPFADEALLEHVTRLTRPAPRTESGMAVEE